jgi:hypothetical protein
VHEITGLDTTMNESEEHIVQKREHGERMRAESESTVGEKGVKIR